MRPDDAFHPEKYAARLEAFERAEIVKDDGFGRGKRGRIPPPAVTREERSAADGGVAAAEEDVEEGAASEKTTLADTRGRGKRKRRGRPGDEPEGEDEPEGGSDSDDSDALFDDNVVEAAAPSSDEKGGDGDGDDGDGDGGGDPLPGAKRYSSGKGWNKTVKEQMRWEAEKKRRAEEMAELRAKWAEEDAGRKRYFDARESRRGKFRKKNARGQPVMRHRVDKILERLEETSSRAGAGK
jgi:hypothetical protein